MSEVIPKPMNPLDPPIHTKRRQLVQVHWGNDAVHINTMFPAEQIRGVEACFHRLILDRGEAMALIDLLQQAERAARDKR